MQFSLRKYFEPTDTKIINVWLKKRDHPQVKFEDIPNVGFICHYGKTPVAAGFLREVEGRNAIFDSLCSNPDMPGGHRNIALEMIVKRVLKEAKRRKIKQVLAYSVDKGTLERSFRHGFVQLPHTVIALDMKKKPSQLR